MKIKEILIEKINITRYYAQVFEIIMDVIQKNSERDEITVRHEITNYLEPLLQKIAQKHSPGTPYSEGITIEFMKLRERSLGQASGMSIVINSEIVTKLLTNYNEGRPINAIISQLSTAIIHELVHVLQHVPQFNKQKYDTEYTSYAGTKDQMYKELRDNTPGVLYYSSPQEIGAFAHNFAIQLLSSLRKNGLPNNFNDLLKNKMIEQMTEPVYKKLSPSIIRRYAKKTYEELSYLIGYGAVKKAKNDLQELYTNIKKSIEDSFESFREEVLIFIDELFYKDHPYTNTQMENELYKIANPYKRNLISTIRSHMKTTRRPVSTINRFNADSITMFDDYINEVNFQYNATIGYIEDLGLESDQMKKELETKLESETLKRDIITQQTDNSVSILHNDTYRIKQQLGNWTGFSY